MRIPAALGRLAKVEGGREWLDGLDDVVAAAVDRWGLTRGEPYAGSTVSLVVPVTTRSGVPAVLKVPFPHPESTHEADALRAWDGRGAVRLLDQWPDPHALLLERCDPGDHLSTIDPREALDVMVSLVRRLGISAGDPFTPLTAEARGWADRLPARWERAGRPFERRVVDAAVDLLRGLAADDSPRVLLHQDLHGDNVLAAVREPWLAIDPKPLVGDPAFAPAPIIRSHEFGHSRQAVLRRFDLLCDRLGLDRGRVRGWTIGQTVAWSLEGTDVLPRHVETAGWLLAVGPGVS